MPKHIVLRQQTEGAAVLDEEIIQDMVRNDVSVVHPLAYVTSNNCSLLTVAAVHRHFELLIVYFSRS